MRAFEVHTKTSAGLVTADYSSALAEVYSLFTFICLSFALAGIHVQTEWPPNKSGK